METIDNLAREWRGSAWQDESTLHQLSPYIGKLKSSIASSLVRKYSKRGEVLYDPFSGCGTIALEAWRAGREVVANDLSPYACLLTKAKLFPYQSLTAALTDLDRMVVAVGRKRSAPDLRHVPAWIRDFYHPETLREVLVWTAILREQERWFLLACLMGILHHQRPGFLSYPSSHTVPYLRINKFPRDEYPGMYEYRDVESRLRAKVERAFRRVPKLDFSISRTCYMRAAEELRLRRTVGAIISSPPYMRQLDYGRDNRLRLWFLECNDWESLDGQVSPREEEFLDLMEQCFAAWRNILKPRAYCVLVIGDVCSREGRDDLPDMVMHLAAEAGFEPVCRYDDAIPDERRVRRGIVGSASETVLVLRNPPVPMRN